MSRLEIALGLIRLGDSKGYSEVLALIEDAMREVDS
jgi:hypothetical protein